MKKITLMLFAFVAFCWQSNAQFTENFDASTDLPVGWNVINLGGVGESGVDGWTIFNQGASAFSGTNIARIQYDAVAHDDYLIAPAITVTAGVNDRVSFYVRSLNSGFLEPYEVRLSTASNTLDTDFSVVLQTEELAIAGSWEQKEFDLSAYVGQTVYVAIRATGTDRDRLGVDDFVSDTVPSCYAAEFASAVAVDDCDNSQFSIIVDVTDLGSSANLEITNDAGVASTMVTETGEVTVGPFPAGTPVVLTLENENEDTCDVVLDSVLDFCPTAANTLDYYNLQWPATLTFPENEAADQLVFAQVYEAGLTDTTTGAAAGIEAWIGYSDTDTDPSGTGWTWEIAPFFSEEGGNNNDQFAVAMQDLGLTEGTYYYASRFTLNAGPYMYGGFEGAWDATTNPSGVLTVTARLAVPGDDCANPIVINTLPYNTTDDTVNYTNFFGNGDSVCNANYLSGNDVVYTYTPSADANINLDLTELTATWSAIHLLDGCPTDEATACVGFAGSSGSADRGIEGVDVVGGTTYYIVISTFATPNSVGYTLDITENTCANATATYTVVSDCGTSGGFNIEVDITDMGTATAVTVTDDQGSAAQSATGATMLTFGPYVNATDVIITISDINDGNCVQTSDALTQLACPPVNDDIATAIAITVDEGYCDGTNTNATNLSATDSGETVGECFQDATANNDVWFTFTVPAGVASVDVSTDFTGGTLLDSELAVYSGMPGSLVEMDCSQDEGVTILSNGSSWNSLITDLAVTVGETYYVQVDGYSDIRQGSFCLDISTNQVLSTINYESEAAFTYYPNPVKNTLTLNAQNTIEQVAMYNMLGQEVLRTNPNAVDSDLDMSNMAIGAYFVKVTIANVTETIRVIKQ
ncbi:T9SS-dependent choice-of-anchor J family protein [Winogradskyella costae]|uniref:T9SS-dependent choice-of-anchor J family protein n=1 Tax=Winogradskyella costae TaxID=2697008 RepID=UPI0015CB1DC7|nr:choice-of-anchor J domain-containing protein [Winogradskyella costae]